MTMTDPVDTDALRMRADALSSGPMAVFELDNAVGDLRRAADEVDRLRVELRHAQEDRAADEADYLVLMVREKRLHTVVQNAPHEFECMNSTYPEEPCSCWKAGVV
jgi:hypothetical protein